MIASIEWHPPGKIIAGTAIDGYAEVADVADLGQAFSSGWTKVSELLVQFRKLEVVAAQSVEVEIWPDSGRVIFVLSNIRSESHRVREIARLVLNIGQLERDYHKLLSTSSDSEAHRQLIESVISPLVSAFVDSEFRSLMLNNHGARVNIVVREYADKETEIVVFDDVNLANAQKS
ncbi:MAG: hypothetical protein K8R36_09390 [Planctomycetales bacterium]|nr:hypothetical protein [Planctomycetales bacterium]